MTTWTTQEKTVTQNERLLEDSAFILLEDNTFRLLEQEGEYSTWTNQIKS